MKRAVVVLSALLLALIAYVASQQAAERGVSTPQTTATRSLTIADLPIPDDAMAVGRPDAPVVVVELFDLHCPFCAVAHQRLGPFLEQMVAEGRLRLVLVDLLVHRDAEELHRRLHCAYHSGADVLRLLDRLYANMTDQANVLAPYGDCNWRYNATKVMKLLYVIAPYTGGRFGTPLFIIIREGRVADVVLGADVNRILRALS